MYTTFKNIFSFSFKMISEIKGLRQQHYICSYIRYCAKVRDYLSFILFPVKAAIRYKLFIFLGDFSANVRYKIIHLHKEGEHQKKM